ncbi:hypothetical protein M231_07855 [Tremella mesenterica]|uniref:PITH domain-containing protein n=1 Tax=Tremella mesenterica TaxID=5217 RepID=A0A4Q1BFB8_TREME|nr:uncharacterized protein TREMEDRAFT_67034 [Tremella mesenterica DSM 1558]EIW72737.1 hypothetical protein TREMEDRAFT_67034 [Tremella mesenterica DSM 1558]RXK34891.1 hypothetical protein M231_07855 [Tremella mesenterica]
MNCDEDIHYEELQDVPDEVRTRLSAGAGGNVNLWKYIDQNNVTGVNLLNPDSAPWVIKTWDQRLDEEKLVESGVDDDLILHIPFTSSLRLRTLLLLPPPPSHPHRSSRLRIYVNLPHCPDFVELEGMRAVMDLDVSQPLRENRGADGRRDIEEWGLKVQKMASVHSVTLLFSEAITSRRSAIYYVGFKGDAKQLLMDISKLGQVAAEDKADNPVDEVTEKRAAGNTTIR